MPTEYTVLFDSRDRVDTPVVPWKFRCNLESINVGALKNVQSVEILGICFPRIKNEDYFFMNIKELPTEMYTTDGLHEEVGTVFYFDNYNLPTNEVKALKGTDFVRKCLNFHPCIPHLNHMTFEFKKHGGDLALSDFDAVSNADIKNISILLKITTL